MVELVKSTIYKILITVLITTKISKIFVRFLWGYQKKPGSSTLRFIYIIENNFKNSTLVYIVKLEKFY